MNSVEFTPVELIAVLRCWYLGIYPTTDIVDTCEVAFCAREKFVALDIMREHEPGIYGVTMKGVLWLQEIRSVPIPEWSARDNPISL